MLHPVPGQVKLQRVLGSLLHSASASAGSRPSFRSLALKSATSRLEDLLEQLRHDAEGRAGGLKPALLSVAVWSGAEAQGLKCEHRKV